MNSEGKFWVSCWSVLGVILLGMLITLAWYSSDKNRLVVEAIKSGADPIAAVCALDNDHGYSQVCTILAARK